MLDTEIRSRAPERAGPPEPARVLADCRAGRPGPTVVAVGALHGNEPAGPAAIRAVAERLESEQLPLAGRFIGLAGNLRALGVGARFLDRDLNRRWSGEAISALPEIPTNASPEDLEQLDLLAELVPMLVAAREPLVFLDLHSTSAPGAPFTCMADVLRNRRVAFALPIPVLLGLEETLDGTFMGYLTELGHVAVAIEGGQSEDPRTADRLEAVIWLALVASGALEADGVADLDGHRARLAAAVSDVPAAVEVRHRHAVRPSDGFAMEAGLVNFSPVSAGQTLARDRTGVVRSPEDGLLLMPLYQVLGEDGFFVARPVSRFWLALSALLRRLRVDRLLPWLPGVSRDPEREDHFVVDRRIARFQALNILHLLGYRRLREEGLRVVVSRRRPDFRGVVELPPELARFGDGRG